MIKAAIEKIEAEKQVHGTKFAGQEVHRDCIPRFDKVLANLRADLEKMDASADSAVEH